MFKLYVKTQKEFGTAEFTLSNVGKIKLDRVECGFVIGGENGKYLYHSIRERNRIVRIFGNRLIKKLIK